MKPLVTLVVFSLVVSGWPARAAAQDLPIRAECHLASTMQVSEGAGCRVASGDICCDMYIGPIYVQTGCAYCHYGMCFDTSEISASCTEIT